MIYGLKQHGYIIICNTYIGFNFQINIYGFVMTYSELLDLLTQLVWLH